MSTTETPTTEPEQLGPQPAAPSRLRGLLNRLARPAVAALAGVLLYLSFPPRPLWWLALPAFAVLGRLLRGRSWKAGLGLGYLFGLGFLLPLLVWTGVEVGPGPWLGLAAIEALFIGAAGAGMAVVSRLPLWPVWSATLWVVAEAARARAPFGGFPWGKVAFGQADGTFLPLAALGGTPVLGFAVVLCGFGLYECVRQALRLRSTGSVRKGAAAAALLTVVVPVAASFGARGLVSDSAEDGTATVAVIQGNVPRLGLDFNSQRRAVLDYHVRETLRLADRVKAGKEPQPDFVLWPENSSDVDPFADDDARAVIDQAAKAIGAPISVGAVVGGYGAKLYNEQVQWDPKLGPVATYDKRQIQPFGEYIPLRGLINTFAPGYTSMVREDFNRGTKPGLFTMAGTKVGIATCYEAAFDWAVRDTVTSGAQLISVPSNNATFDRSEMTYQQLAMSRVRAVEHSRTVTVPVTSGVSAVIMPDGKVVQKTAMFTPASLVAKVPLRSSQTPATKLGTLPEWALVAAAAAGLAWAITRSVRGRRGNGS
ncbi:apolipoprotein N-acyltransferase [Streptomyces violascens]|uniref:Apolipoprotein N-acyltransferase n=1 Tax=Streptomyces violascens TaxID=67381 RepID=A0ABQ3QGV0_9ACTN|nr:apolipoprotein N-acyltransferase [Streptomyces violascens]GGT90327.1 apolipoprotein N-acyltransferase [Streptomyces violascens]GHI36479.1 apolipoprotein N-acyltransferase [Streptomyces violascens]